MKHKRNITFHMVICFILMISGVIPNVQIASGKSADWPEKPSVTSGAAIVMELKTGVILYEKNSTKQHYPASITKILTSLVALEHASLQDTITFSKDSVFNIERGSSLCGIDWGEQLSLEDCLYGIMLESGNEVSYAVAENVGGTYENFVALMNDKAKELGAVNSHFANPHGLTQEDHYTCAYDMALIARAAMQNPAFATIVGTRTHTVAPTNKQPETRYWANHHKFVKQLIHYDGCIGGKTGWTSKSKYTLVTYATRNNMTLVCVIMDEESATNQYTETARLLDYGFDQFSMYQIAAVEGQDWIESTGFFSPTFSVLEKKTPLIYIDPEDAIVLPNEVSIKDTEKTIAFHSFATEKDEQQNILDLVPGDIKIGSITYTYHDQIVGSASIYFKRWNAVLPSRISENSESMDNTLDQSHIKTEDANFIPNRSTDTTKQSWVPMFITGVLVSIVFAGIFYYITVERPRLQRRKRYLERRKNRRYYS